MNQPRKVLLVDDDPQIRSSLQGILEESGFHVVAAADGEQAEALFGSEKFEAVISDIQMPKRSGLELAKNLKDRQDTSMILMTGFREYIDAISEYEIPVEGFLAKPFRKDELIELLDRCLKARQSSALEAHNAEDFMKLSLEEFVAGKKIQSSIYVRINATKYLKIAHQGEDIEVERIRSMKERNVKHLYLKREDFGKYVGFTLKIAEGVAKMKSIEPERKTKFFKYTGEVILEQLHLQGVDEDTFENAKIFLENSIATIADDTNAFTLLEILNNHANFVYAHSLAVSFYSLMLAKVVGWNSPVNRFKIATAGLFHDIGKKEIQLEILFKSRGELTHEERHVYEEHPIRGAALLRDIRSIPTDILQIVLHHHEYWNGTGFPSHLTSKSIHPIARLITLVDEFVRLTLNAPGSPKFTPAEAIERLTSPSEKILDKQFFPGLRKMFNLPELEKKNEPPKRP